MDNPAIKTTSPLDDAPAMTGENSLRAQPWNGKIVLRGDPDQPGFLKHCEQVFELELPLTANTVISNKNHKIFLLGPNEWMIHC